jgi:hypothetical protein
MRRELMNGTDFSWEMPYIDQFAARSHVFLPLSRSHPIKKILNIGRLEEYRHWH